MVWEDPCTVCHLNHSDEWVLEEGRKTDSNTNLAEHCLGAETLGSLLLRMWALATASFLYLFLITDCFSCSNRVLFNSLSSCLKMLALITTSLLLCLPHHSSGQLHSVSFPRHFLGGSLLNPYLSLVSSHIFFIAGSFTCSSHLEFYLNDFI